jgi:hypothetical protein
VADNPCEVVFTYVDEDGKVNSKIYQNIYFGDFHNHPFVKQLNCGGTSGKMELIGCSITSMSKREFATPEHNADVGFKIAEDKSKEEDINNVMKTDSGVAGEINKHKAKAEKEKGVEEAHEKILRAET